MFFLRVHRITREHTHEVTENGMLCSWIHYPRRLFINLWDFFKKDILGARMGWFCFVQWFLVISPFILHGGDGWYHLLYHNLPMLLLIIWASKN